MKSISSTAWELVFGVLVCTAVMEIVILGFVPDKTSCSLGLLIGMITAIAMTIHMDLSIEKMVGMGEEDARKGSINGYAVRTVCLIVILLLVALTEQANLLACICGVFTLKVAAYLQPITHRIIRRMRE